ncbi:MAG TPA: hypothetical protein VK438_06880, partial [Xanthobacteraceae bacterium]|nr:hypothetical protein [Xanthobacteraceae bacterium]
MDDKSTRLIYEIENRSPSPVTLLLNIPVVESMVKLPFLQSVSLKDFSRSFFETEVRVPVTIRQAVIRVSDEANKQPLAADVVGVYAPAEGRRLISDESLFDSV